jgi:hypothetical protein
MTFRNVLQSIAGPMRSTSLSPNATLEAQFLPARSAAFVEAAGLVNHHGIGFFRNGEILGS